MDSEIDNELNFSKHISNVCKKINNQFNVMLRFRKLTRREILFKLYKAYILPHFYYCSSVWHFCGARDADKFEAINKRILRFIDTWRFLVPAHHSSFKSQLYFVV